MYDYDNTNSHVRNVYVLMMMTVFVVSFVFAAVHEFLLIYIKQRAAAFSIQMPLYPFNNSSQDVGNISRSLFSHFCLPVGMCYRVF
jgi:hypothetical protein